ncbi:hypothetical protein BS50DRAFT_568779 [Corynespora cassiicola Philippines]|uniref:Uncharacterized protein n=1 Tax=Corynespora cassiicola Philippines TaxID=1448308 RepID=A0A2T2P686_CORCC|nr:hypothetical protein BS50DRAFT_568779 [Corynespora cassiicola Philippines]
MPGIREFCGLSFTPYPQRETTVSIGSSPSSETYHAHDNTAIGHSRTKAYKQYQINHQVFHELTDHGPVWYCGECGDGPFSDWQVCCASCNHGKCGTCVIAS